MKISTIVLIIISNLILFFGFQEFSNEKLIANEHINNTIKEQDYEKKIDSLLSEYSKRKEFNGNVFLLKDGKVICNKSYGYADSLQEEALSPSHKFGIGSIYKEFPAVSIMKLNEEGLLKLEDKINIYLPDLPSWSDSISVINLLQYTSGLPMINWDKYFSQNQTVTNELVMQDILNIKKLEFAPGSKYLYTNNSPFLLMRIVEEISGQNFPDFLEETFLIPLRMSGTEMKKQFPYVERELMAIPMNSNYEEDRYKLELSGMLLTTTAIDLSTWITQLNKAQLINNASLGFLAQTAQLSEDNMQSPIGTCKLNAGKVMEHIHHGQMGNYEALAVRNNEEDMTLVILTNQKNRNVFEISESIISLLKRMD